MNRAWYYIIILSSIIFCFFRAATAQVNDANMWTGVEIEKKISQSLSFEYVHETRFNENITETGSIINELGVNYRFNKKSRISVFYRLNYQRQLNNMYIPINRVYFDYLYKTNINNVEIDLRLRVQSQQKNIIIIDSDGNTKYAVRPRITLKYPILKFSPYFNFEAYFPVFYNEYKPIDKLRFAIGTEYSFNKKNSFDLKYMIQKELYTNNPVTDFILSLSYNFKF
ncbi:MAG TPA: DUF2490 domain-containing protein [Bacteroidales bacterium]|nr:DUF2490 domain-containing protein [Bacteroidales bacterium]